MPAFSSNIEVSVRVRPFSSKELASNSRMITELVEDTRINLFNPKLEGSQSSHDHRDRFKQFTFDHCYLSVSRQQPGYASQQIIFNDIGLDVLKSFIEGYNTCILCYGQTGTGKTFTMMGNQNNEEMGLTPKICETLFKRIEDSNNSESSTLCFKTLISYMEIYNEKLRDLFDFDAQKSHLNSSQNLGKNLKIREHPNKGIYVQNLKQFSVSDLSTTMRYLNKGNQCRSTASTHVHDKSSRSHAIFTITFIQAKVESEMPIEIISKLNLVDLAGSERASNDLVYNKKQLKEGSNINKSLVSLGNVISILAESNRKSSNFLSHSDLSLNKDGQAESKSSFVPYRDSLLTYLLKDSLGGNAKTHMIANISPASCCYHETLNTLLFAQRAKKIVNKLKINEDPKTALIKELKEEIFRLKELLSKSSSLCSMSLLNYDSMSVVNNNAISGSQLELILERNETKAQELTLSWIDKWNQTKDLSSSLTNSFLNSPSARSQKFSSGLILQSDLPFIVLINDDRLSAGIMIFYIKEGDTILGKDDNCSDISLNDKNLSDTHCIFSNTDSIVTLAPVDSSMCTVNGTEIKLKTKLTQGDVIQVGKYTFRFNHPEESGKLRQSDKEMDLKILKSQSLPSLARSNLSNEGLLMAKCSKTNNSTKVEEFRSISRSSSFMSSKSDYSILEPRFKINSINEIRNDMKKLAKMKLQSNPVSDNSYGLLSQQFQQEQIKCKNDYDQKLKDWNEKISHTKSDAGHFDYENYFYSTLPNNKCLDYIDNFQTGSQVGQQKHRLILELKFFMNLKQLRLTFAEEMGRHKLAADKAEAVNKQTCVEMPIVGQHLDPVDLPAADAEAELNSSNISSASCPTLCASKCPNCSHMALKRCRSASDLLADKNLAIVLDVNPTQNNMIHANMDLILNKKKVIIYNRGRARKNVRSVLKKPMKKTKSSSRKLTVLSLDSCVTGAKMVVADSESPSSSSRAPSIESSRTHSSSKNYKPVKHSVNNCCHRTKNCIDLDLHAHHHKHLFPFYFSYNLKDSDDDCLNKKTKNLFKSSMNRIDNTHATFLNCLRDWNDPFLHGHKPVKPYGCQRCESCACRSVHSSTNSLNRESCSNQTESSRHYPHSKLNKKIVQHELLAGFQPIIRCRSSANVPKALNHCIKVVKPRSSPLYPRKILNNSKRSNNSIESDKESSDNVSKDEEFKVLFQSSPDISLTSKGTNELVQNNEMLRKTNMDKTERDEFMLAGSLRNTKDHDLSIEKHELQCLDNGSKMKLENGENLINVLSSSTSSSIEDIAYDDSLQGDSFESDSLMLDCDKKQLEKKDDRSELKETSSCQAMSTFVSDQDSMSKMDLINLNIDEATQDKGCNNQSRPSSVQHGFKEIKSKRRVSLNDSIEEERNLLKKPSPNRSYSEGYLNDNNDTDIDLDFDCSNSDLSTNRNTLSLHMEPDQRGKTRSGSFDRVKAERQSPIHQLEDQIKFYERVKDTFLANLDKPACLSPQSSSPKRRRSTSSEQKFLQCDKLVYKVCDYGDHATLNELTMQMPVEHRLVQSISVPAIVVHETRKENEKSIKDFGCHGNRDQNIDKSIEKDLFQAEQTFNQQHSTQSLKQQCDKFRRTKLCSFLSSASKKRHKMDDQPHQATCSTESQNLRVLLDQELAADEEDEFFVAISSHSLRTGSCPEFYWHPGSKWSPKRARSETNLVALKSYENITQSNYVQMINSMIHGAISDMADPDYADYLKRHIQGLFDNFTPVLMKSKSNEEIAMASPSRHKISHIINQTMPKSLSFDLKLLEDNNSDDDAMDFSKFGLGIKDHESSDDSLRSDQLERSFVQSTGTDVEDLLADLIEQIESLDNFESNELKSSTRINFDDLPNDTKLNGSVHQASMNDDSTPFGSESCASTIVNVTLVKDNKNASRMPVEPSDHQDDDVNLMNSSPSDDDSETRRLIPSDSDSDSDGYHGDHDDGEKRPRSAGLSDSLEDDVIIECKIDYRVKSGSDSDSSFTDSDDMEKHSCSDYDNMKQSVGMSGDEPESAMLSTSVHSLNSVESAHNLVNETLASLTSLNSEQKSVDEEDEPEFVFGDDFADLDENWLQEDDWFGGSAMGPAESMHSVRQLDPIAEEEEEIVLKKSHDLKHLFDNVENFKISFEYKYRPESEKLRSQECNIRSLLGSTTPTVTKSQSNLHSDHDASQALTQQNEQESSCVDIQIGEESGDTLTDRVDYQQQTSEEAKETVETEKSESSTECVEEVQENCFLQVQIEHREQNDESLTSQESCETLTEKVEVHKDLERNNGQGSDNNRVQNEKNGESITECFEEVQENCFLQVEIEHREQNDESLTSEQNIDHKHSDPSSETIAHQSQETNLLIENCFLEVEVQHQNDDSMTSQENCETLTEKMDDEKHQAEVHKDLESNNGQGSDNNGVQNEKNGESLTECFEEVQKNCFLQVQIEHREQNDESMTSQESCETLPEKIDPEENFLEVQNHLEIKYNDHTSETISQQSQETNLLIENENSESLTECFEEIQKNCFLQVEIKHREQNDESLTSQESCETLTEKIEDDKHLIEMQNYLEISNGQAGEENKEPVSFEQIQNDCFLEVEVKHQNDEPLTDQFDVHEHLESAKNDLEIDNGQTNDKTRDQKEKNNESLTGCFEVIQKDCVFEVEIKHREQLNESFTSPENCGTITEINEFKKYLIESNNGQGSDNNGVQNEKNGESLTECFEEIQKNCFFQVQIEHREQNDESLTSQESYETLTEKNDHNKYLVENKNDQTSANNRVPSPAGCFEETETEIKHQDQNDESLTSQTESSDTLAEDSVVQLQINHDQISDNTFNFTQETNETFHSLTESMNNQSLTSWYEQIENDLCLLQVQIKHKEQNDESLTSQESCEQELEIKCEKNESVGSEENGGDKFLNETLTEDQAETSLHGKHGAKSKSCSSIETTSEKCDEMQKDSVLETRYCEWCESDSSSDAMLSQKRPDMQKDSLLDTQYTANGDDTSSSECQSADNVTDEEEIHVEYFEYVISNDLYEQVHAAECPIERKSDSELDLSKLELNVMRDEETNTSDRLHQVLSDIDKQIDVKSPVSSLAHDKSYQVCPAELAVNMVDSQTQSTPPLSPIKKLGPAKKNAYTETDDSHIFSQFLITSEEQKLRQKLKEKENSLRQTTIGTQTTQSTQIEHLPAIQNQREARVPQKILILNDDTQSAHTDLKLNVRQKIKIENLQGQGHGQGHGQSYGQGQGRLVKVMDDEFHELPTRIKTTHLKCVDVQTEEEGDEEQEEEEEERGEAGRSRSVSNSSTFIDLLSLNLDRSKTWVELTEAKLNYMIGETDAVLRSMNLDSSSSSSSSSDIDDDHHNSHRPKTSLTNSLNLNLNTTTSSHTSPRIHLISPEHTLNCLTSTTKTIEEMTQLYLDNYKRQLEESRKELSNKMSLLEAEKEKIGKIRDSRKKELYMRRQAAIQAFKLERQRELTNSLNEDLNSHSESIVCDDLEDDEFSRTLNTSKRLLSNELPSHKREKLAKIRRDVVLGSALRPEPYVTPRLDATKSQNHSAAHSRLLIPVQKSYVIEETVQTSRVEHTTSSSSNSSSIIDESRLLLKEYEQLRNDSVSEIQRAQDSLNASLLWLENQKQNEPSDDSYAFISEYISETVESDRSKKTSHQKTCTTQATRNHEPNLDAARAAIPSIPLRQQRPESYHQCQDSARSRKSTCSESIPIIRQHRIQIPIEKKFPSQSIHLSPRPHSCQVHHPTSPRNEAPRRQTIRLELIKCQNRTQPRSQSPTIQPKFRPVNHLTNEQASHHRFPLTSLSKTSTDTSVGNLPTAMRIKFANNSPQSSVLFLNKKNTRCRLCAGGAPLENDKKKFLSHNSIPIYF